jgi:formate hydrogenlyase transcriptional activator
VVSQKGTLREHEAALILQTLRDAGGMIGGPRGAAARLGLKRTTLVSKMKRLGIYQPRHQRVTSESDDGNESSQSIAYGM